MPFVFLPGTLAHLFGVAKREYYFSPAWRTGFLQSALSGGSRKMDRRVFILKGMLGGHRSLTLLWGPGSRFGTTLDCLSDVS